MTSERKAAYNKRSFSLAGTVNSIEKAPTPPGVGVSIKGGEQNELEGILSLLYYQIVLSKNVLDKMII